MGFARPPDGTDIGENAGYDYRFPDDQAARDYILKDMGRTPEQLVRLATAGMTGFAVAGVMEVLGKLEWLWGERGLAMRPLPPKIDEAASLFLRNTPYGVPAELARVVTFAQEGVQAVELIGQLIPVAKGIRAFIKETEGAEESLPAWKSKLQLIAAFTYFAAENEKLSPPLGHKELEAFALVVGYRLPLSEEAGDGQGEFLNDPLTARNRAENWRRTLNRAESNGIIEVLRRTNTVITTTEK